MVAGQPRAAFGLGARRNGMLPSWLAWATTVLGATRLTLEGAHVREITAFALPELFPQFGLPAELN